MARRHPPSASLVWRRLTKRWLPRTLFGRSALIIILPIVVMQAAVGWAFFEAHWQTVTRQLSESLAGDVAWNVALYEADPRPAAVTRLARLTERTQGLQLSVAPGAALPRPRRPALFPTFDAPLRRALGERLDALFWIDTDRYPAFVDIRVAAKGGVVRILAPRARAFSTRGHVFLLWLSGATLLLTLVAVVFIRNQVRAIERLAAAAEAFGRGLEAPHFKPHGAREVRQAAEAFLAMKARIQRQITQRTTMLAAVSHDLRTPLTRLRLEMAMADPTTAAQAEQVQRVKRDLADMERMIDEFLAFASGVGGEAVETITLQPLIAAIASDARQNSKDQANQGQTSTNVAIAVDPSLTAHVRPVALRRALSNLVMNAAAYACTVRIEAGRTRFGGLEILVDDDGPGIAPELREEAFRPFNRLDVSRNQNLNGVGLGLAIARDVARGHGGEVTLSDSPMGGLRATLRLPG